MDAETDWTHDPLAVAMARLIAVLIVTFRLRQITRWLAARLEGGTP